MISQKRTDQTSQHSVAAGNQSVAFRLRFSRRRTIGINVYPDGSVLVTAPWRTGLKTIRAMLGQRIDWVLKQQRRFAQLPPKPRPRCYENGEQFRYLDQRYTLQVGYSRVPIVTLVDQRVIVTVADPADRGAVRTALESWYRKQAAQIIGERIVQRIDEVRPFGIPPPTQWRLRKMQRRWGSCSQHGVILFNPELVATAPACIDYVIVHELCHLVELNHSPSYYQLLSRVMPDWQIHKQHLNNTVDAKLD